MAIIGLGECNKNMIYPFIGGISNLVVYTIIYFFSDSIKLDNHPFLLGINAGLGMSLAIIPYLYILTFTKKKQLNNNSNKYIANLIKKKDPIAKRDKYLTLFLCAFLDFIQKALFFLFRNNITIFFWVFDIIFLNLFTSMVTQNKLYKHQYFSSGIMIFFGILLNAVFLYKIPLEDIPILIMNIFIEMMYCLGIVLAKYGMDDLFCSPFEITFYEGIFALILNVIFLIISTKIPIPFEKIWNFSKFFQISEYNGKQYLDNFYTYIDEINYKEVLFFILIMIRRLTFNLFSHITIKHFTSSHVILLFIISELVMNFEEKSLIKNIIMAIVFIVELIMILIFCEIIELNFCGFEKNTRKNIKKRANLSINDEANIGSMDIGEGMEIVIEDDFSLNNNSIEETN